MTENQNFTYFYKYRPLIDDTKFNGINENTLKLLEHGELYFSKPEDFNDPFDCVIEHDANITREDIKNYCNKKNFSDTKTNKILENFSVNPQKIIDLLSESIQTNIFKIFCLSKNERNILMWSHYANNHTGICVGIKTYFLNSKLIIKIKNGYLCPYFHPDSIELVHVKYEKEPPKYNIITREGDPWKSIITKADFWYYEEEFRLILEHKYIIKNPICIEKTEIGEILFGIKTPDKIKEKIIDIIKTYPDPKPNVYQCFRTKGHYAISKERIEI